VGAGHSVGFGVADCADSGLVSRLFRQAFLFRKHQDLIGVFASIPRAGKPDPNSNP
jgi:hypothetical protein